MSVLLTTTDSVEGRTITRYLGIVSGESVMGTNLFRDFFASIRDVIGGRSGGYENALREAKDTALAEMAEQARAMGATAVVGIDLDYQVIGGDSKTMLLVAVNGTAVVLA
ncbi:YbjQ family protein [Insolitispirillum peregrinum]|uniref:UPF0145 protein SAMN05421779_102505 n=1 Tax=Insolitispirillum peregrinum TaxID=80876 RepID=A0A1N7JWX9_9PROT|nr:YbjQ family protein [Insolitispirillum peregrinum]SIS53859.1 Uncharacterized conserved protein YbjQ, UPF0145 family [Insolitispirillum peregrinum]